MVAFQQTRTRPLLGLGSILRCIAVIGFCNCSAASRAQATASRDDAQAETLLTIVVRDVPSPSARLIWVIYAADAQLPGLFSRGQPYRIGIAVSTGQSTLIDVGRLPAGHYLFIVGQDIDGDQDIDALVEPRGYSGYDGCLVPNWLKGAQMSIEVFLHCNRPDPKVPG